MSWECHMQFSYEGVLLTKKLSVHTAVTKLKNFGQNQFDSFQSGDPIVEGMRNIALWDIKQ